MSLLEGHADVVMDGVGPAVVPTVDEIRARFQRRREQPGRVEAAVRRLLGLDAKLRQYRDGAGLRPRRGRPGRHGRLQPGLGRPPPTLPDRAELADPAPGSPGWPGVLG